MWSSPLIWIVIAIALFWAVGAYNRLVRLRSAVVQAFGSLDAHLVRWLAMLGEFDAAQVTAGTLDRHARSLLQGATTQLTACLAVARARPLKADAVAALSAACAVVDTVWPTLLPDADADDNHRRMAPWRARWHAELRTHNEQAARIFNDAVAHYNAAIAQFPAQLLAGFLVSPARVLSIAREGNS